MKKSLSKSVSGEALQRLVQAGVESPFLLERIKYAEAATLLSHHLRPMAGTERVYPSMVIPQASGRVGISDPPIGNFTADKQYGPKGLRDVVRPDEGFKWICPDWSAVEGWIVSHRCQDQADLEVKRLGLDLHTVTAITILRYPDPPFEPTKEALRSESGQEYRRRVGFDERTRTLIKNCRYCLNYSHGDKFGRNAENAMDRYATELQMTTAELREYGRLYLKGKPGLVAWKKQRWDSAWRLKGARTAFGRRRRFPSTDERQRLNTEKEGLNHEVQGTVADLMKMTMVALAGIGCRMVLQRHDGWYSEVPVGWDRMEEYRAIVEREWMIDGRPISFPAEYEEWM